MDGDRMVHLTTVATEFHGRVLAARLGAAGVLTQLRGAVGGPYPMGDVLVFVPAEEAEAAREILVIDEAEAVVADASAPATSRTRAWVWPTLVAVLFVVVDLLVRLSR